MVAPDCAVRRFVSAVPEVIELPEPSAILLEVRVRELFVVVRVLFAVRVKSPVPSPSESAFRLVVPLVVKLEDSKIPFSAFTVKL